MLVRTLDGFGLSQHLALTWLLPLISNSTIYCSLEILVLFEDMGGQEEAAGCRLQTSPTPTTEAIWGMNHDVRCLYLCLFSKSAPPVNMYIYILKIYSSWRIQSQYVNFTHIDCTYCTLYISYHKSGKTHYMSYRDWLIWLSTMVSSSIHVVVKGFHSILWLSSIPQCLYHFFLYSVMC